MDSGYAAWAARWRVPLGFLLGVAYLVFAQPTPKLLFSGSAAVLAGLLIRAWAAGCLDKNQHLAIGGPYAYTRNPLYLGSLAMGAGFAVAGGSWMLGLALVILFLLIYWPVMRREEAFLRQQFRGAFPGYARVVPFFFPALRARTGGGEPFRWSQYRKNREYQAALGSATLIAFLAAKMMLK
jgi:protein-S-isoprenylcysteine O-methyltransferase Ste14